MIRRRHVDGATATAAAEADGHDPGRAAAPAFVGSSSETISAPDAESSGVGSVSANASPAAVETATTTTLSDTVGVVNGVTVSASATPSSAAAPAAPNVSAAATANTNPAVAAHDAKDKDARDRELGTAFDCNICFDTPNDPVVTACGHLYCWSCLYRWMRLHAEAPQCPVCKSSVERHKVTPIYGRGRSSAAGDPRLASPVSDAAGGNGVHDALPPRPAGQRDAAAPQLAAPPFGIHPAVFGRMTTYGNYGSLSLNTFSLFPNLFGLQVAYPHVNEPTRDTPNPTAEQETQEQVARVFLFLTFFVIMVITWF